MQALVTKKKDRMKTGHVPQSPRCALSSAIPVPIDTEEVKRDGWHNHGILVVRADDQRLGWIERQIIEQIGRKLYGGCRRRG